MERRQLLPGSARSGRCCNRSTTKGCAHDPRAPSLLPHPPFSYTPRQARKLSETRKEEPQREEKGRKRRTEWRTNGESKLFFSDLDAVSSKGLLEFREGHHRLIDRFGEQRGGENSGDVPRDTSE